MSSDDGNSKKEIAQVGKKYRGSMVTNIESEVSRTHMVWQTDEDGERYPTYRVRKFITLDTGMIMIEDEYQTNYHCEGEYKELKYNEPESPHKNMRDILRVERKPKSPKKSKKKNKSNKGGSSGGGSSDEDESSSRPSFSGIALPELDDEEESTSAAAAAAAEAAAKEKEEAQERARKEAEEEAERARKQAEEEEAERARKQAEEEEAAERARKQAEEEAELARQRAIAEAEAEKERQRLKASQEAVERRKKEAEAKKERERIRKQKRAKWEPAAIWVFSPGKAKSITEEMPTTDEEKKAAWKKRNKDKLFIGVWSFEAGPEDQVKQAPPPQEQQQQQDEQALGVVDESYYKGWKPLKDVIVYPPGHDLPSNIIMSKRKKGVVDGVWCYKPGSEPNEDNDDDWKPENTENILVCPPDKKPPSGLKAQGKWCCKSTNGSWPPIAKPPQKALVYPKARLPTKAYPYLDAAATVSSGKGHEIPKNKQILIGVWDHGDTIARGSTKKDDGEDRWKAQPVLMYEDGDEPENNDKKPHGYWRYTADAKPDNDGNWEPSDVIFYTPGVTPPEYPTNKDHPGGTWTVDPEADNVQWPPSPIKPPQKATVYPKASAPNKKSSLDKDECVGTWMFSPGGMDDDEISNDWMPQNVLMYEAGSEPTDLDDDAVHGEWRYALGAEPDEEGNWNPDDICFYVPGQDPPPEDKSKEQRRGGIWTMPPKALAVQWPPPRIKPPQKGVVYAPGRIPKSRKKDMCLGKWSFSPGSRDSKSGKDWAPKNVLVYDAGHEPANVSSSRTPHGEWRIATDASQDEEGNWNPDDVCYYVPGEMPPDDQKEQPGGVWVSENQEWPPPLIKTAQKATVYPKDKVPDSVDKDDECAGKWMFAPGSDMEEMINNWNPQDLTLYEDGCEPPGIDDSSTPHGKWGYAPGAEPDQEGNWNPDDVWFFASDETPPPDDDWQPMGVWTFSAGGGPPPPPQPEVPMTPPGKMQARVSVQRTPPVARTYVDTHFDDNGPPPRVIWVYPEEKLPTRGRLLGKTGIWKYGPDSKIQKKFAKEGVHIYESGDLPDTVDKTIPNGVWGCPRDAIPEPNGDYNPADMQFCAPGETPPKDFVPKGKWIFPPTWRGARRMDWYHFDYGEGTSTRESTTLNLDGSISNLNFVDSA